MSEIQAIVAELRRLASKTGGEPLPEAGAMASRLILRALASPNFDDPAWLAFREKYKAHPHILSFVPFLKQTGHDAGFPTIRQNTANIPDAIKIAADVIEKSAPRPAPMLRKKAIEILEALSESRVPMDLMDLAAAAGEGCSRKTCGDYASSLEQQGLVVRVSERGGVVITDAGRKAIPAKKTKNAH